MRRNCLLNTLLKKKGRMEVTGRRGRRRKLLLDSKLDLNLRKKLVKCYIMEHSFVWF